MRPPSRNQTAGSAGDWLAHAQSDLNLARLARGRKDVLPEQVCFHAQQAAEKAVKAVLLKKNVEFPLIHDIEQLFEIAMQGQIALPPEVMEAGALNPYAVEYRYPGFWEELSPADVDEAICLAEHVIAWAKPLIRGG